MNGAKAFLPEKKSDTFTFQGKEYPIYSIVKLSDKGRKELRTNLKCVQICAYHYDTYKSDNHYWYYITRAELYPHSSNYGMWLSPEWTQIAPDEIIEQIVTIAPLPGVTENIQNKKVANYWHAEIVWQWVKCVLLCLCGCIFSGLFVKVCVWLCAFWYYYIKCNKIHEQYIRVSFDTFENKWKMTQNMAFDLYLNPNNKCHKIDNF